MQVQLCFPVHLLSRFSRDPWRVPGVRPRSSSARSYCKYAVKVTLTFATLQRNTWSRTQIHENSMVFAEFVSGQAVTARQPQMLRCLLLRQDRCLLLRQDRCLLLRLDRCLLLPPTSMMLEASRFDQIIPALPQVTALLVNHTVTEKLILPQRETPKQATF